MARVLEVAVERWPIAGVFSISRGAKREAVVVVATIREGSLVGRGEATPYARYGESVEASVAAIRGVAAAVADGIDRAFLQTLLPAGAARNAVDCALWDLEAKRAGTSVAALCGLPAPPVLETAYTISLAAPEAMAAAARLAGRPILKLKLGGDGDPERLAAVRAAAPAARLIVDANESWSPANFGQNVEAALAAGVELIEQPLPAEADEFLFTVDRPIPVCADESAHLGEDLARLIGGYDAVNIKLDKTGGLTAAIDVLNEARALGFKVMVGCMVATSLAMAPAMLIAGSADFVDLDGPLLLARDRVPGLRYEGSRIFPAPPALWG
ncbi:MAG TPA: N-acetyl-D-Glu racemase DgcA [Bauldia sp.]|nr:N-acetyl-D-Glu racemase DgcA [Bauldia sp.]